MNTIEYWILYWMLTTLIDYFYHVFFEKLVDCYCNKDNNPLPEKLFKALIIYKRYLPSSVFYIRHLSVPA